MNPLKLEITRDNNADAGYNVAWVKISNKDLFIITSVDNKGPAYTAGMREEHLSWSIISVDEFYSSNPEELLKLLEFTRKPNFKFLIEICPTKI